LTAPFEFTLSAGEEIMTCDTLNAITPIDGRYADKLISMNPLVSEFGLIKYRVIVEIEWFKALANCPDIKELPALSSSALNFLNQIAANFSETDATRVKLIEKKTNHDVKAVEYYLGELFSNNVDLKGKTHFLHFAATSEDINNLAYGLMLKDVLSVVISPTIQKLLSQLKQLSIEHASVPLLARTHGQSATPTTVGKEFAIFYSRLKQQYEVLGHIPIKGKCNGATGNFNAHSLAYPNIDWISFSEQFITDLGLTNNRLTTQIEPHDAMAGLFHCISRINTILIDCSRDCWGYISLGYFKQKLVSGEVGSSTMPHKVNPIDFENAEGNFGLSNALLHHMAEKLCISRWQRDLSDSTVLRNSGTAFSYAQLGFLSTLKGLSKLEINVEAISTDCSNAWEVLTEAVQTIMRKHGIADAYDQIKILSRGKALTQESYHQIIEQLALSEAAQNELNQLTPQLYLGLAEKLASSPAI
jgi:adenylosuccinate lyase